MNQNVHIRSLHFHMHMFTKSSVLLSANQKTVNSRVKESTVCYTTVNQSKAGKKLQKTKIQIGKKQHVIKCHCYILCHEHGTNTFYFLLFFSHFSPSQFLVSLQNTLVAIACRRSQRRAKMAISVVQDTNLSGGEDKPKLEEATQAGGSHAVTV